MNSAIRHRVNAPVMSPGLGEYRMGATDASATVPWKTADAMGFIALLVGTEQVVGYYVQLPYSDWRVGFVLLVLGPAFYSFTGGWGRIGEYITNLRRLRIVRLQRPAGVDVVEEGRQKAAKYQIRSHVQNLVQKYLIQSHDATETALRACVGRLKGYDGVSGELARAYEYLLEDSRRRMSDLNVAANRSLQDAPEENKPSIEMLVAQLVDVAGDNFRIWRAMNGLAQAPAIGLPRPTEIEAANTALERLKSELRDAVHMNGFSSVRFISEHLQPLSQTMTASIAPELTRLRAEGLHLIRNEFESNPNNLKLYLEREAVWAARVRETMTRLGCTPTEISRVMDISNSEIGQAAVGARYGPDGDWLIGLMEMRLSRLWEVIAAHA